jgi:hypothetical protein
MGHREVGWGSMECFNQVEDGDSGGPLLTF